MFILEYLLRVALLSGMFLVLLVPFLFLGFLMHFLSNMIYDRMGRIFGYKAYIYITAPGVMVHELSHAIFCLIFGHKIMKIQFFSPENDGTLGYVTHQYYTKNLYQQVGNFFIGTGPLWGGMFVLWLLSMLLLPESAWRVDLENDASKEVFMNVIFSAYFWKRWQTWLWLYLFFTVASHITLSPPDLKGAWRGFLYLMLLVVIFELLFGWWAGLHDVLVSGIMKFFTFALRQMGGILIISFLTVLLFSLFVPKRKI